MLKYAAYLGIFILIAHFLGIYYNWYVILGWYDIPMHMLGGLWVGLMLAHFFGQKHSLIDPGNRFWLTFVFILGTTTAIGVFWEFYEFFVSQILPHLAPSFDIGHMYLADTLKDILDDMVGGSSAGIISFFYFRKGK
jgi:hypothetical protein